MIKINFNIKKHLPKIIAGVIVLAIAGVFTKAAIWEKQYIAAKSGTERSAPLEVHPEGGVSDERVTEVKQPKATITLLLTNHAFYLLKSWALKMLESLASVSAMMAQWAPLIIFTM